MSQITIRVTLALAGVMAVMIVTNNYYAQAMECLARMEQLAHAAIPTALAVALLYRVLMIIKDKNE